MNENGNGKQKKKPDYIKEGAFVSIAINAIYWTMEHHPCDDCEVMNYYASIQANLASILARIITRLEDKHKPIDIDTVKTIEYEMSYLLENAEKYLLKD